MGTERPENDAGAAEAATRERRERDRRIDLHRNGCRLVTEIDPDKGGPDELMYKPRRYPFGGEETVEISQTMDRVTGISRITLVVSDSTRHPRGTATISLHPERSPELEAEGLTEDDLAELERSLEALLPRDVLPEE